MPALNFPDSPTNGQTFSGYVYSTTEGVWNRLPDAPGINLSNLGDVSVSSLSSGQSLIYNGTDWSNTPLSNNAIINGNFDIWQRGTSFASISSGSYSSDRWQVVFDGTGVRTVSQQTFPTGQAPVAGYEGTFFYRYSQTTAGSGATFGGIQQRIEDVRTLAGQNVTLSFWAKADTNRTLLPFLDQNFGSGGSINSSIALGSASLTTSWQRFTMTIALPGISGKTIGTSSFLQLYFGVPNNVLQTIDIWGVQLEAGSVATPFRLAGGGNPGAELALCQRYYYRTDTGADARVGVGYNRNTTTANIFVPFPVSMRNAPVTFETSGTATHYGLTFLATGAVCSVVPTAINASRSGATLQFTVASGLTAGQGSSGYTVNGTAGFLAWSAEL
jgi:hypothetical protein